MKIADQNLLTGLARRLFAPILFLGLLWQTVHSVNASSDFNVIELTIDRLHQAISNRQITCEQIVARYIERIDKLDQSSGLNSIIYINPEALNRARVLDKQYHSAGKMKSLHCVPTIVKDNFDTRDMPTEAGSIALKGSLPPDDAFMVKRLREQDAIIIAKSNMGEWAFSPYNTISSSHGETGNAYDLSRVPAGSSGGTASAIAANFGIVGMGTDTGNSIRGPASHLALVGIRSTIGMTSRDGVVPLLLNRDIAGPLMRTVRDTAIVFNVIAGYDPADSSTLPARDKRKPDYTDYLKKDGLNGVRLGLIRQLYLQDGIDREVNEVFDQALGDLKRAGAEIVDPVEIENFKELIGATGFCSRFYFDLNNYLTTLGPAAKIKSLDEIVKRKQYREQNQGPMDWAMGQTGDPTRQSPPCVDVQGDPRRKALLDAVLATMKKYRLDAMIYPSWSYPPRKIGDLDSPHGNNSPIIAPHSGQPAITVPMGYTSGGLPLGLQFLARPFDEHRLLQYAYAYEQMSGHRRPPVAFGTLKK